MEKRELVKTLASVKTFSSPIGFSPDSRWLVLRGDARSTLSGVSSATIHDARTGKVQASLGEWGYGRFIFSPTGSHVLGVPTVNILRKGASQSPVWLWRIDDGERVYRLESNDPMIEAIFSTDGKRIFSAYSGPSGRVLIKVWDTASGRELLAFESHLWARIGGESQFRLKLSVDGYRLTAIDERHEQVWDVTPRPQEVAPVK